MKSTQPVTDNLIHRDEAFDFGLGLFETIAIEDKRPIFPEKHLERIRNSMKQIGISNPRADCSLHTDKISELAAQCPLGRHALKISLSKENLLFTTRPGGYSPADYKKGFRLRTSKILRNETSPFTYHKTMNYAENITEKRNAKVNGFEEPIFLNTKGYLTEGATTNLFFVREGKLYTPSTESGILPGILRSYLLETEAVTELLITPEDLSQFEEAFVTNSLLGIMPVISIDDQIFISHQQTIKLLRSYEQNTGAHLL